MSSLPFEDHAANIVLQDLYHVIAGHMDVDVIIPSLRKKRWLSLNKAQYLQNVRGNPLTDQEKSQYLLNNVLMSGGYDALNALLDALDETSQELQPHANLAVKLRKQYQTMCKQIEEGVEPQSIPAPTPTARSVPQMIPDIIPQVLNHMAQSFASTTSQVSTSCDHDKRQRSAQAPAYSFVVAISGTIGSSMYSSSLNNDPDGDIKNSSSTPPSSHAPSPDPIISNSRFDGIDEEPDEYLTSSLSLTKRLPCKKNRSHLNYDAPPTMYANELPNGVAGGVELIEAVNTVKDVGNDKKEVTIACPLDEYDVLPVLTRLNEPLPDMVSIKLILLGESGVGKTSIIERFLSGGFKQATVTIGSAHNTCYLYHTIKKINVILAIWDTAGQERFRSICQNYYTDADAVVLVFDLTDENSLLSVEDYWSKALKNNLRNPDVPILLVGNKYDESSKVTEQLRRTAMDMAQRLGFKDYRETSAKSGYEVVAVFETIVSLALGSHHISHTDVFINLESQKSVQQHQKCLPC